MWKLTQAFPFKSLLLRSPSQFYHSNPSKSLLSLITSLSTFSHNRACSSTPDLNVKNSVLVDYLVASLKFPKTQALSVSSSFSRTKSLEKPEEVVHFFKGLGFSDTHIQSIAHGLPRILFANVEKTLKPKVIFFHELGLSGPGLGSFISRNPNILKCSLDRTLKPCIHIIKKVLQSDGRSRSKEHVNDDLFRILIRSNRIVYMSSQLEANITYLESCGVVGSQLSALLLRQTRIFTMHKDKLAELVSRALHMNFTMGSGMLVHAIHSLSCISIKALDGKFEVFKVFGFSKDEIDLMFRKSPYVFGLSEAKLRCKLEFFLNNIKINKPVLVQHPALLSYSIEERVIPRYRVLEILMSRRLLSEDSSFSRPMCLSNGQFLQKYILPFETDAEELLLAYNGQFLNTSEK